MLHTKRAHTFLLMCGERLLSAHVTWLIFVNFTRDRNLRMDNFVPF